MRASMVVLALLATPLAMGVSQTGSGLPGRSSCNNGQGDENRSAQGTAHAHQGLCAPQDPPPPPPPPPPLPPPPSCVATAPGSGPFSLSGQVYVDASPWPGLANWCVTATGDNGVTATTVSDDLGNYIFKGLPAGNYTVCETVQSGWTETYPRTGPACPTGTGWTITLSVGDALLVWFGNLQTP